MKTEGYLKLGFAIIEQAAEDVKELSKAGIIQRGKVVEKWPTMKYKDGWTRSKCFLHDYNSRGKVIELLEFFQRGDVRKLLCMMHSEVDENKILAKLNLA